ncbi:MAG: TetR/AcrR family transcriptional regulator [Tetrasphaera sp.]
MASIARHARVSVQTVYNAVGRKPALLKGVWDITLAGDFEPVPMLDRHLATSVWEAPDGREALRRYARMGRVIYARVAPVVPVLLAAAGNPDVRPVWAAVDAEHAAGTNAVARSLAEKYGLRDGLSAAEAADILWTLTSPDVADRLVRRRGWSLERYEGWLGNAMADSLIGDRATSTT